MKNHQNFGLPNVFSKIRALQYKWTAPASHVMRSYHAHWITCLSFMSNFKPNFGLKSDLKSFIFLTTLKEETKVYLLEDFW